MFEKYLRKFISIQQKFLLFSVVNDGAEVSELGSFFFCSFQARSQKCEKLRHLFPPARVEQLVSHCKDFHGIWYLSIFRKSVEKILVSLKSNKNNGYNT